MNDDAAREKLIALMKSLDCMFNGHDSDTDAKITGIVLLVFPFGDHEGRISYLSNGAKRSDVARMMDHIRGDDDNVMLEKMAETIAQEISLEKEIALAAARIALRTYRQD
jgi:hypothetical protein